MNSDLKECRHAGKQLEKLGSEICTLCRALDRDCLVDALGEAGQAVRLATWLYAELQKKIAERDEEKSWPHPRH
jgi:hypothetical protein